MSAQTTAISMLYINRSMLKTRSVLIVLLICIFAGNVFAQNAPRKEKLNIKLTFSANVDDTGLKNQTKSYVEKGLKQLGDIIRITRLDWLFLYLNQKQKPARKRT